MRAVNWLKKAWQEACAENRIKTEHDEIRKKIDKTISIGDMESFAFFLKTAPQRDKFIKYNFAHIVRRCIEHDNLALFEHALQLKENAGPNLTLTYSSYDAPGFSSILQRKEALLYCALNNGAAKIALKLAQNPETDIYNMGEHTIIDVDLGTKYVAEKKPQKLGPAIELSRRKNMDEVTAVLAERMAADLLNEAQALRARKKQPGSPKP